MATIITSNRNVITAVEDADEVVGSLPINVVHIGGGSPGSSGSPDIYSVSENEDLLIVDASDGDLTIILHEAALPRFRALNIKRVDSSGNNITVVGTGSPIETIDGFGFQQIVGQYTNLTIANDGFEWWIL